MPQVRWDESKPRRLTAQAGHLAEVLTHKLHAQGAPVAEDHLGFQIVLFITCTRGQKPTLGGRMVISKKQGSTACCQEWGGLQSSLERGLQPVRFRGSGTNNSDDLEQPNLASQVAFEQGVGSGNPQRMLQTKIIVRYYETQKILCK